MSQASDKRDALIFPVAGIVLMAWTASLVIGAVTGSYVPLSITTPVMLMLAGYVFGVNLVRRGSGNGG